MKTNGVLIAQYPGSTEDTPERKERDLEREKKRSEKRPASSRLNWGRTNCFLVEGIGTLDHLLVISESNETLEGNYGYCYDD